MHTPLIDDAVVARIADAAGDPRRPLMFVDAAIHTLDPVVGDFAAADDVLHHAGYVFHRR